ncbi:M20 family metallopeptidase [Actinoplanes sp. NPDC049265]|uniref:M20 metallopeptidase family protein n=1 Tax=Actinoplanes sp. NPDC049265 TaxID=3363902 RepID=UPI0037129871
MPNVSRRTVLAGAAASFAGALPAPRLPRPLDDLIALRRDLHAHPEPAGQERRTAAVVAARLRHAGLAVTTGVGGYGVVGVLTGARHGRTVAYRADLDAVPPSDQGGGEMVAHLCGHDIHTTVGVGVAETLARHRDRLAGTVAFVFQPAEEALSGAAAMLAGGLLDRIRPVEIHALHCGPFPVGEFVVNPGFGLPGLDRGRVTLTGADAAARAQGLAAEINQLGTVAPPRTTEDYDRLVTALLTPGSPLARSVFMAASAEGGQVRVFYRCWPAERHAEIRQSVDRIARSWGAAGAEFPDDPFPAMVVPERDGLALRRHLRRAGERVRTAYAAVPFNGEDFALFLNRMPGTFTWLGVRTPGRPVESAAPHNPAFDPDERAIGHGVRAMSSWLIHRAAAAGR